MLTKVETSRRGSGDGQVLGAMLVVLGAAWLLNQADVVDLGWRAVLSALLVTLGAGLVLTARRTGAGLVIVGVVLTVVLAASSSAPTFDFRWNREFRGTHDRTIRPTALPSAPLSIHETAGDVDLDLRDVAAFEGTRTVKVKVHFGQLTIYLPSTVKVSITADVAAGDVQLLDRPSRDGLGVDDSYTDPGFEEAAQKLVIDANVVTGEILVIRTDPE